MLGVAALLSACAAGPSTTIVRTEQASATYQSWTMNMQSTLGELPHQIVLKPYNEGGKLTVCGYIAGTTSSAGQQLIEAWWRQAELTLNDTPIGAGYFLSFRAPGDRQATCIATGAAWKEEFQSRGLRLNAKGQAARIAL